MRPDVLLLDEPFSPLEAPGAGCDVGRREKEEGQGVYGDARFGDGEGPRFVKLVQPRYPAQARAAQKEGGCSCG